MRFAYCPDKGKVIINHEDEMLEKFTEIIKSYSSIFVKYNCSFVVGCGWNNFLKNDNSNNRLPFKNGYSCYIYCNVERNGETIRYEDKDGEVDYLKHQSLGIYRQYQGFSFV